MRQRKVPLRQCVGCQEQKPKKSLLRVVRTPEDEILLDPTGKKSGRGAYICPDADCLERARKKKALNRAFKGDVPDDIYERLQQELAAVTERQ
ncbi:RNase P modulator RnpM [Numidum massiliense]|uniref:RNase P modulator RnpM n=1 Tax=Numidum massiliense TaxID=1522315 RepID=UPI0006D58669|nr:YlxR family protein [Numidum massiliense]